MSFFFSDDSLARGDLSKSGVSKETLHNLECRACPLAKGYAQTPQMAPSGSGLSGVYFLGEAPGKGEDLHGEPFIGKSGELLKKILSEIWLEILGRKKKLSSSKVNPFVKEYFRFNNCVRTRPPQNKTPGFVEIECCRPSVQRDIEKIKPKIIVGLGNIPLRWAIGDSGVYAWRGRFIPIKIGSHICWFFPTFHPSFLSRKRKRWGREIIKSHEEQAFERDLRLILSHSKNIKPPKIDEKDQVFDNIDTFDGSHPSHLRRFKKAIRRFERLEEVAIDLETSSKEPKNLKFRKVYPLGKGSRILSVSIGTFDYTIAFSLDHPQSKWVPDELKEVKKILKKFLKNPSVAKIAHNLSFEVSWFIKFFGKDWIYDTRWEDTQAQGYVIRGVSDDKKSWSLLSLKNLCLWRFGIDIKSLSILDKNNLDYEDLDRVLLYNGVDSKYTHKLFITQRKVLEGEGQEEVYRRQVSRVLSTCLTTYKGLEVDQEVVRAFHEKYTKELRKAEKKLKAVPDIKEFRKVYQHRLNPASDLDCVLFFRDMLKFPQGKRRDGKYSVDKETLRRIDHKAAGLIIEYREAQKLLTTYIDVLLEEKQRFIWPDGKLHPKYNTTATSTRRLSSSDPNSQNFPSRKNKEIRSQIIAPEGHWLVSIDYGQIEARVLAMASKDENLVEALWRGYDIHGDWAEKIIDLFPEIIDQVAKIIKEDTDEAIFKMVRYYAKNKLVFPAYYGAKAPSISRSLGMSQDKGEILLEAFWEQFPGVKAWQEEVKRGYYEDGYIELLTGFRRYAPFSKPNAIINSPIQGTASDIVVDAMDRLSEIAIRTNKEQYQPVMNIHDDLGFYVPQETLEEDIEFIAETMLDCRFDFINVPLSIEVAAGFDWYNLEEIAELNDSKTRKRI